MKFGALKQRIVSGVFFTGGAQILRQLLQLGTVALLARLLEPGAFGLVAMAAATLAFCQLLADLGLGASIEREQNLTAEQEGSLLVLNASIAALLCVVVWLAAPWFAALVGMADLSWVLRALAPAFLLAGALRTRSSSLARGLRFRELAAVELAAVVVGATTSIVLASLGWGAAALVAGSAAQQIGWSLAVIRAAGLPASLRFRAASVRPLLGFGGYLTAFNVTNFFTRKLDDLLVGGLMGTFALGLYEKSYALMMLPLTQLTAVVGRVMYPALSKVKDDPERFAFLYLGAVRKIAGLAFPLAAVCMVAAGPVVGIILGPRFEAAVPIFATLSLVMGLQPLTSSTGWIYLAKARMRRYLALGVFVTLFLTVAFVLGALQGTPLAMARYYAVGYLALFLPMMLVGLRTAGITFRAFLNRVGAPAVAAIAAWIAARVLPAMPFPATVAVMAVTYSAVHALLDRHAFFDLFRFLNPRRAFEV